MFAKIVLIFSLSISYLFAEKKAPLLIGVEAIPFMPYSEVSEKKYKGIFHDIFTKFADVEGITFKFSPLPISRLYTEFYNGNLDFKLPANPYWQQNIKRKRKLNISYSLPIVSYQDGLMIRPENKNFKIKDLKKLGVVSGFTPWEYLDQIKSGKILSKENPSIEGLLQQGILGRVDAIYINIEVGRYYLKDRLKSEGKLMFAQHLPSTKSTYQLATIKHPQIIKKFNKFLKNHKKMIKSLQQKYGKREI